MTVIVHTRNAGKYLDEVLSLLHDFDELMVVDMESDDDTLEIAERHGCRIMKIEQMGYVEPARDPAMRKAKHDWVFFVDADEIIPEKLVESLRKFISTPEGAKALAIARKNYMLDFWDRASYPDYQLRVLDRRNCHWPRYVHSNPVVEGTIRYLPRHRRDLAMLHKPPTMEERMERLNRYTTLEVERRKSMKLSWLKFWLRPKIRFFKSFVIKGGFRDGMRGYIAARNEAAYQHFYMTKILEYQLRQKGKIR